MLGGNPLQAWGYGVPNGNTTIQSKLYHFSDTTSGSSTVCRLRGGQSSSLWNCLTGNNSGHSVNQSVNDYCLSFLSFP